MKILVTGSTGKVGSVVLKELIKRGADLRVLVRTSASLSLSRNKQMMEQFKTLDTTTISSATNHIKI